MRHRRHHHEAAPPASRTSLSAPTEAATVEEKKVEGNDDKEDFTEWRNATMSDPLLECAVVQIGEEYCDAIGALQVVDIWIYYMDIVIVLDGMGKLACSEIRAI
jgi:hypothetical protein